MSAACLGAGGLAEECEGTWAAEASDLLLDAWVELVLEHAVGTCRYAPHAPTSLAAPILGDDPPVVMRNNRRCLVQAKSTPGSPQSCGMLRKLCVSAEGSSTREVWSCQSAKMRE